MKYIDAYRMVKQAEDYQITWKQRQMAPKGFFYDPNTGNFHSVDRPESPGFSTYNDALSFSKRTPGSGTWSSEAMTKGNDYVEQEQAKYRQQWEKLNRTPSSLPQTMRQQSVTSSGGNGFVPRTVPTQQPSARQADTKVRTFAGFR